MRAGAKKIARLHILTARPRGYQRNCWRTRRQRWTTDKKLAKIFGNGRVCCIPMTSMGKFLDAHLEGSSLDQHNSILHQCVRLLLTSNHEMQQRLGKLNWRQSLQGWWPVDTRARMAILMRPWPHSSQCHWLRGPGTQEDEKYTHDELLT